MAQAAGLLGAGLACAMFAWTAGVRAIEIGDPYFESVGDSESIPDNNITALAEDANISLEGIEVDDPAVSTRREGYARLLWEKRQRKGMSLDEARRRLYNGNYFGSCMVANGDADALVSGVNLHYPETIRPALEVIGAHPKAGIVSGLYMLVFEHHVVICGDTTVNIEPTAEQLSQIAYAADSLRDAISQLTAATARLMKAATYVPVAML